MDADRFDALTRRLTSAASSRRGLLRGLAGSTLSGVVAAVGVADAGALHFTCRHVGERCTRGRQCCSGRCRGPEGSKTCRAHHTGTCRAGQDSCAEGTAGNTCNNSTSCHCARTTGKASFCYAVFHSCFECERDTECAAHTGVAGSACVVCAQCGAEGTACMTPCG